MVFFKEDNFVAPRAIEPPRESVLKPAPGSPEQKALNGPVKPEEVERQTMSQVNILAAVDTVGPRCVLRPFKHVTK